MKQYCIFCNTKVYLLNDNRVKCPKCNKKYSIKKWQKEFEIIKAFCNNLTALKASKKLNITYATILKKYQSYRELLIPYLEDEYLKYINSINEYHEFVYLDKNKQKDKNRIFEAYNFLAFDYNKGVYTILMPSLIKYKNILIEDNMQTQYNKQLWDFLNFNKISKLKEINNRLKEFYLYLNKELKKYKGIKSENFIYYLKECEFKFNYPLEERVKILKILLLSR